MQFFKRSLRPLLVAALVTGAACTVPAHDEPSTSTETVQDELVTVFEGTMSSSGTSWTTHSIDIDQTGELSLTLDWDNPSADFNLFLYDTDGNVVAYQNTTTAKPEIITFDIDEPGTYAIGIKCKTGSGAYTLTSDFAPDAVEHDFSGNTNASGNSWITHTFEAVDGDTIDATLEWANASSNLNLFLFDPDGDLVVFANGTTERPEVVSTTADQTGLWSVALKCKNGSTPYDIHVLVTSDETSTLPSVPGYPGQPQDGTLFWGAAVSGNGDPGPRHEGPSGHPLSLRRTFYQWSARTGKLINTASDDLAHDRLPWVSVKTPSWAAMAAGQHDGEIDQMLAALDALPGPVWLTIHHEPEGGGGVNAPDDPAGPAGHLGMNERVRARMTALGVDNVALAPILMSWTWTSASGRNPDEWWKAGVYDFLGVDHYKNSENSLLDGTWTKVRQWAEAKGVEVAVGEWGMRGTNNAAGQRVYDWYDQAVGSHGDGVGARVVGMSAFDSGLNSPTGSWELTGAQLTAFHDLLGDSRTANVNEW